ncbi:hypothetical protein PMAYCL1PPCAC_04411, partial [Pristionchus mayeri]
ADASSPLNITCVEYCEFTAKTSTLYSNSSKVDVYLDDYYKKVECGANDLFGLIYQSRLLNHPTYMYCDINNWHCGSEIITNDTTTPQHFECLQKCTNFDR